MNFSFSDVKTSVDRPVFFDKNLQVLYNEAMPGNMLEKISQEDDEEQ